MCSLIILSDVSARKCTRRLHTSECVNSRLKKNLFIPIKVQLITISSVIPYISEINSTSSSLKKKKPQEIEREREREEEKGERKGKRDGKEKKKEKGKEEERLKKKEKERKEEEKIEKAIQEMYRPFQMHSLARS